jgi:hypothetical protein
VPSEQDDMRAPGDRLPNAELVQGRPSTSPIPARQRLFVSLSTTAQPWPIGAFGSGWPCITLTRMPVNEPKMFICSYVEDAGAGCPGRCTGRWVIVSLRVVNRSIAWGATGRNDLCQLRVWARVRLSYWQGAANRGRRLICGIVLSRNDSRNPTYHRVVAA